ncbi:MAG: 16S rRNA (uracil(1498)-N(3))-methyltransferase [Opitutales bacterium]|nr:16S rRNA (uracil(1498)-N(3))-methyltransferase [Opitutales bacterium]MCH8539199.1 16S rRNA (uracil(1498)-N(3))-methyltransferase [Opitutales bacterium]
MAGFPRCYVSPSESLPPRVGESFTLSEEESHHLTRVLRVRPGQQITLFDGQGMTWEATLNELPRHRPALAKVESETRHPKPPYQLHLAQAISKGKSMDQLVRRVVELGLTDLTPLITERCEGLPGSPIEWKKRKQRWHTQVVEAAKQSGNPFLPTLHEPTTLQDFLALKRTGVKSYAGMLEVPGQPIGELFPDSGKWTAPPKILWIIGPEGDFSPSEYRDLLAAGIIPVNFGPLVMRCETAALFALANTVSHLPFSS